ncbi:MAG TPA: hypothetical protein VMO47_02800, partial [Rhodothermales bacterium]|nr:hypothetical protein [Rhodothermales bacterium]
MRRFVVIIALAMVGFANPLGSLNSSVDSPGRIEPPEITVQESTSTGELSLVTAAWRSPLASEIASLGPSFNAADLVTTTTAALDRTSRTFRLPSLEQPLVQILSSDFESVTLNGVSQRTLEQLADLLPRDVVGVIGIGLMQGEPVGTLDVRMLTFDPESLTLRRYRRLSVRTSHAPLVAAQAGKRAGPGGSSPHLAVTRSALADGSWFKVPVTEEGIYRIDADYIAALGLSPQGIDPARLRVFGNGGKPLPALNGDPRPADLVEQPIYVFHDNDTAFEPGEFALFYGVGPRGWTYDTERKDLGH